MNFDLNKLNLILVWLLPFHQQFISDKDFRRI